MAESFSAPDPDVTPSRGAALGALTKMAGPLPVWGWIAVLGVAGTIVVVRRRGATSSRATTPDQVTYAQQAQIPTIGGAAGGGAATVSGGMPKPATNDDWRSQGVTILVAKGYSPLAVDTAMAKYLQGVSLDTSERALIDIALAQLGTPPYPPPASPSSPTTTTPVPAYILGSNVSRNVNGQATGLDESYNTSAPDLPAGHPTTVDGLHLDSDPATGQVTGGYWRSGAVRIPLPQVAIDIYNSSNYDEKGYAGALHAATA